MFWEGQAGLQSAVAGGDVLVLSALILTSGRDRTQLWQFRVPSVLLLRNGCQRLATLAQMTQQVEHEPLQVSELTDMLEAANRI